MTKCKTTSALPPIPSPGDQDVFTEPLRCEVYLRNDTYGTYEAQQSVIRRVESLADRGVFDEAGVESEWASVHIKQGEDKDDALATVEEFEDWADENGFSLAPAFQRRERYVTGTTARREAVVFPVVALAVYEGTELRAVLPSSDEFGHYTVHEALEGFERGDLDRWLSRFDGIDVERTEPHIETAAAF